MKRITKIKMDPKTILPSSALSPIVNTYCNEVMTKAPNAGPAQCLAPPKILISTTNNGTLIEKTSLAVTYETNTACIPPAIPAKAEEIKRAINLVLKVGTPITSAASSSS